MCFQSVLFPGLNEPASRETGEAPACFHDLNLDRIVETVTRGWREYDLAPFFHTTLNNLDAIAYRQEIMQDLENSALMQVVQLFSQKMREMRMHLPQTKEYYYRHQKQRLFLDAVGIYCEAVEGLAASLAGIDVASRGMRAFREYLAKYVASDSFRQLAADGAAIKSALSAIRYCLHICNGRVTVRHFEGQRDYSATVEKAFEKFRRGAAKDYRVKDAYLTGMDHIQEQVVDRLARLHPDTFLALVNFHAKHANYLDQAVSRFDREIQFYVAYLTHIAVLQQAGLSFCYPKLSDGSKEIGVRGTFDLALAGTLVDNKQAVVTNDFYLRGPERIFVVSGPNHGGKTTFARTFGQLHYLAVLGCPVPGTEARLFLCDRIFTHFEREENIETFRGKLQDDLVRIRSILNEATANSIVVINEIFSSTTLKDAVYLGKKIIAKLSALDMLAVCVTFLDELASCSEKTVSMVSLVDPDNPVIRTYKLERRPADGIAYALAIAEKHHVTYDWLMKRIKT